MTLEAQPPELYAGVVVERASSGATASSSGTKGKYYMNVMGCQMNLAVRHTPLTFLVLLFAGLCTAGGESTRP